MNFINRIFLFYKNLIFGNRAWIKKILILGLIWFFIGVIVAAFSPAIKNTILTALKNILREIIPIKSNVLELIPLIFFQNLRSMLIALFFGVLLGIPSMLIISFNAFIIGLVYVYLVEKSLLFGHLAFIVLLAPHSIFEIPALIIACSFGLRLGFFWKIKEPKLKWRRKFLLCLKQNFYLIPLIIGFLFLAAVIESTVTVYLAGIFFGSYKLF